MICPPLRCDKDEGRSRAARLPDYPRIPLPVNGVEASARDCCPRFACASVRAHMGDILDLSERYWRGEIPPREMWRPTGKSEELAAGVHFHAWANVTAIRTEAGLVLVGHGHVFRARPNVCRRARRGAGSAPRRRLHARSRGSRVRPAPISRRGAGEGWPAPSIVGHRNIAGRFDRYRLTRAVERPHQLAAVLHPLRLADGVRLSDGRLRRRACPRGGRRAARAESRAGRDRRPYLALVARAPHPLHRRSLLLGRAQRRQSRRRSSATRRNGRARCGPWPDAARSCSSPATACPSWERPACARRSRTPRSGWRALERETVTRMNAGLALDQILAEVRPPAHLADRPYLRAGTTSPSTSCGTSGGSTAAGGMASPRI